MKHWVYLQFARRKINKKQWVRLLLPRLVSVLNIRHMMILIDEPVLTAEAVVEELVDLKYKDESRKHLREIIDLLDRRTHEAVARSQSG